MFGAYELPFFGKGALLPFALSPWSWWTNPVYHLTRKLADAAVGGASTHTHAHTHKRVPGAAVVTTVNCENNIYLSGTLDGDKALMGLIR